MQMVIIFLHYPTDTSTLCIRIAYKVFLFESDYQKSCHPFWTKCAVFDIDNVLLSVGAVLAGQEVARHIGQMKNIS